MCIHVCGMCGDLQPSPDYDKMLSFSFSTAPALQALRSAFMNQVFNLGVLSVESTPAQIIIIAYAFLNLVIVSSAQ